MKKALRMCHGDQNDNKDELKKGKKIFLDCKAQKIIPLK